MTTRRIPLRRNLRRQISPKAIEAFRLMEKARAACACKPRDWEGKYWEHEQCPACEEWWQHHRVVHRELKLKPWDWPAFEYPDDVNPYPAGSVAAEHWEGERKARPEAFAHHDELAALAT